MTKLQETLARLRKEAESERESAGYNGSYQGQVIAAEKLDMLDEIEQALLD
jgi:hypothetical protein